jgi:FkbM family methyltransferase
MSHLFRAPPEVAAIRRAKLLADRTPRRTRGSIRLLGYDIEYADLRSVCLQWDEIFVRHRLRFSSRRGTPRILDCGANVGLASLYFKRAWPDARITAFEADPELAAILERNLLRNGCADVEVIHAAVWDRTGRLAFRCEGTDSGAIDVLAGALDGAPVEVPAVRLRDRLEQEATVDLLKLDIEGAELVVLRDIADQLHKVSNVVVEVHEFHPSKRLLGEILETFVQAGFEYAIDDFLAAEWRPPRMAADGPFPNQPLCWMLTVKAWRIRAASVDRVKSDA